MRINKIFCTRCNKHICRDECNPLYIRKRHGYKRIGVLCYSCYIEMLEYLGIYEKWYQNIKSKQIYLLGMYVNIHTYIRNRGINERLI